jgi:hypothetical protein
VKQKRLITGEQEMIERKSGGRSCIGHEGREAIYARTDLIDPGKAASRRHLSFKSGDFRPVASALAQ